MLMLTKSLSSLVVLAAMASLVIIVSSSLASPLDASQEGTTTTTRPSDTYFGVDANDKKSVEEKQRELSHEKWRQMMGDTDIEGMDFSPEMKNPMDLLGPIFKGMFGSEKNAGETLKKIAQTVLKALAEGPKTNGSANVTPDVASGQVQPLQAMLKKFVDLMFKKE